MSTLSDELLDQLEQHPPLPARETVLELVREVKRLRKLIWTPHTAEFLEAVRIEAAHQRDRWSDGHDRMKDDSDWYWLLGWLIGKAVHAKDDREKRLHHIVTSAAALLNWHRLETEKEAEENPCGS